MADTKITSLTELNATPASGDTLYIVDVSDTTDGATGTSKKITRTNLIGGLATSGANSDITSLTGLTTPLTVAQGGTGAATLTGILLGAGTSAVTALSSSGTGNVVRVAGATMTTPTLGVATATSYNKITVTAPATSATLTLAQGSSLITAGAYATTLTATATTGVTLPTTGTLATLAGSETLSGKVLTLPQINDTSSDHQYILAVSELTADRTVTLPLLASADEFVFKDHTVTMTNKRVTKRVTTISSHATPTVNTDNCDVVSITAQGEAITSMTTNLSGTETNFQTLIFRILDDGTGRAITWGAAFEPRGIALPTTTTASKLLTVGFMYDTVDSIWGCIASVEEA